LRIKQAVCYPMVKPPDMGVEAFFKLMADIGYPAVEIWERGDDFEEVMALAKKYHLTVCSMSGHLIERLNNRSYHDQIEAEVRTSIDVAAKRGIPGLILVSGNRLPYQTDAEAIEAVADGIRRVAPYAEQKGINLNLELMNSKVDHPGYLCDHTNWAMVVLRQVNSSRVKLLYDIYHMQIMEGDVIRTIQENISWIGGLHTAGNPGRNELGADQELNYVGICRAIAATDYDLYVTHEFQPKGDLTAALRQAFEVCDQQ